ncbi:MAG: hypothetical protein IJL87_00825 [Clostridia bacterium]|nr:hypothetical protein [Clostridia bacterium]
MDGLIFLVYFGMPIASFVVFLVSLIKYISAKRSPQKVESGVLKEMKTTWIVSLLFFICSTASIVGFMVVFIQALADM